MKKNIENRKDIALLVHSFYAKIRKDTNIGQFFNDVIQDWDEHLEKLTDFWEMNLFGGKNYHGNPIKTHIEVDKQSGSIISSHEFGIWLNHWFDTIDELYEGQNADTLKRRARKMSTMLYMNMFNNRG
jgi:hemoglobin